MTGNKSTTGLRRSSSPKYLTPDLELVIKGSGPFAVSNPSLVPEHRSNVSFPTTLRNSNDVPSELGFLKLLKLYGFYTLCYSEITTFP